MILRFPNLDTLRLALTSGLIPLAVSRSAAVATFDDADQLWVETPTALTKAVQADLKKLGVIVDRTAGGAGAVTVATWLELLPLVRDSSAIEKPETTAVLFDLPGAELVRMVSEMLRLGNDRQSFRWFADGTAGRALLRVYGPPYYSLLRAFDRAGNAAGPAAFVERAPNIWIELGWSHPLIANIKAPTGKLLLLRSPRQWTVLDDAPFRDVYDALEFSLPEAPAAWQESTLEGRMRVPLSLRPGGNLDGAELWVLRDNAVEELNRVVQNADDQLLHRLRFAVAQHGAETIVVVRIAHSKLAPPVVVLQGAVGYRPYLKLPNLFVPCGMALHPPVRRDLVRKLLADDLARAVWLTAGAGHSFQPASLPEDAFRPLIDWVDYVIDQDQAALTAWVQAARFDFEAFICAEDGQPRPKAPPPEKGRGTRARSAAEKSRAAEQRQEFKKLDGAQPGPPTREDELAVPGEPGALQLRLRALEEEFLAIEGGLDVMERARLWPQLAALHTAVDASDDAGVCWMNALWFPEADTEELAHDWFRAETLALGEKDGGSWARASSRRSRDEVAGAELDRLLANDDPSSADLRSLAAFVVWSARRQPLPAVLLDRLNPVQRFLEKHERLLPIRAAWLAWHHLVQLAGGDVLSLAQARDRLLERLFQQGLRPEQDLPGFLRFAGQPNQERFRAVRQWLAELPDAARAWSLRSGAANSQATLPTAAYIDLLFAFGLARLGESAPARALVDQAKALDFPRDEVHKFLFDAFEHRIRHALDGKPHSGALPDEMMARVAGMGSMPRYLAERLLQFSRVLEPDRAFDAQRHLKYHNEPLRVELSNLLQARNRPEIEKLAERLLSGAAEAPEKLAPVLEDCLAAAPSVGEEFARGLLARVPAVWDALAGSADPQSLPGRNSLLNGALTAAAHFDLVERVRPLLERIEALLASQQGEQRIETIEALAGQCFRGLRKLGMRAKIDALLSQMADVLAAGQSAPTVARTDVASMCALLHVAGGWYYFGRDEQANSLVRTVRAALFDKDANLLPKDLARLARTYVQAVGQAPVETAQQLLGEFFAKLPPIRDGLTTASHYFVLHLGVVESVVLAIVSDDFTMGVRARRWLDDDEYLVRKRMHHDFRTLQGSIG